MISEELKENIKRHYGDSDEDLRDLGAIMDSLEDLDKVEAMKTQLQTMTIESDRKLKELDDSWRKRYRERFFDGDVTVPDIEEPDSDERDAEDITIDEYLESIKENKR